jgi:Ca-activated chloride channel family protein
MKSYKRPLWLYPLFQIPLICLGFCLIAAALFWLLGFGRPSVAVAVALDLSNSTYSGQTFNSPGTILDREIQAVQAYLTENNAEVLRRPNQVKIFGFGGAVKPLTNSFNSNSEKVKEELLAALEKKELAQEIQPTATDISLAIETSTTALKSVPQKCRELILVTDGQATVSPIVVADAVTNKVKINAVLVGSEAPLLRAATFTTGGIYLSGASTSLKAFFTDKFFTKFNSNLKWIVFWLGLAWIALMWMLILPLDRWIFQGLMGMSMDLSGKLAISNALFWTVSTLSAIWRFFGIPFLSGC